jgi:DNA-binding Lrp family transcriptional regulator
MRPSRYSSASSRPKLEEIAKRQTVSRSTAARRVRELRVRGLLGEASQERPTETS